ncbi:MAG TPA: adenylate/guanylate cyclase domain-containing protein [Actinomycetota bacterium]|nr:adenylate/guanylate cyclase domain-containing protein [Actinomycetota bacterium]
MSELPTGTVTFLFTDIEGSTRLLQEFGDRCAVILLEHAMIVRRAIEECDGVEVNTEGDSFFVVFRSPSEAGRAAVTAQRDLAANHFPEGAIVRVRMGLHTGEGFLGGDDYLGLDVNRAARISSAAHGGQVLISAATRGLVEHALPEGVSLRDLGPHRLKDIAHPEHLYDLVIEGLPSDFPPPRTLDARPNNLPPQLTSFVGREEEMAEVKGLLERTRLLTLTGPGGTGKTRLALEVGAERLTDYANGSYFVDLSAVTDPALVPSAVAAALGIPEMPERPFLETVKDHLSAKELLLILDNFEQVVEAAPAVEALLVAAPRLKVLVTSRVVLSLRGEQEYAVPPLEPPDPDDLPALPTLRRFEAVRLFTERAVAVSPRFQVTDENAGAVAAITARLDGLPLAIELAATRTKVLTPQQMLPRLQERLSILTSGPRSLPERQRTLRAAIAWSHDLLDESERELFACLSVFTGGWTLSSADAVCGPNELGSDLLEGMTSLVDQSLVRRSGTEDHPRFYMLETIREFGLEQLRESGRLDDLRRRHADRFLGLAIEAEAHLAADDQVQWLDRCDREHANIRAALRWAIEVGEADRAQEAAGALWRFWQQRDHLAEGRAWLQEILAMPLDGGPSAARAKALIGAGGLAWWQKDREAAGVCYEEAVTIERELGDPVRLGEALYNLSFVVAGEDIDSAVSMLEESLELFRRAGHEPGVAEVLSMLVIRDAEAGNWDPVIARLEETTSIWRGLGDRLHLAFDLVWLAFAYGRVGRSADAWSTGLDALKLFCEVDNPTGIGITFYDLAFLATWEGNHEDAVRLAAASQALSEQAGGPPGGFAGLLEGDPVAEARTHLSEDAAQRAWDEGFNMSVDEAVALARSAPGG